jgi:hypothetical protein
VKIWVFVADVTDEFILGLDILRAYDASVGVGSHMLLLGQDEVPVREVPAASVLTPLRPTESHRNRRPVCWQCGGTGNLRRECSWRTTKDVANKRDWSRDCAAGGRGSSMSQIAESTQLSDEEQ